jgi:hypothetical protein
MLRAASAFAFTDDFDLAVALAKRVVAHVDLFVDYPRKYLAWQAVQPLTRVPGAWDALATVGIRRCGHRRVLGSHVQCFRLFARVPACATVGVRRTREEGLRSGDSRSLLAGRRCLPEPPLPWLGGSLGPTLVDRARKGLKHQFVVEATEIPAATESRDDYKQTVCPKRGQHLVASGQRHRPRSGDYRTGARTSARTGSSPLPASRCSSLQPSSGPLAACFSLLQLVAANTSGLLIPRSQVRSLPGPSHPR